MKIGGILNILLLLCLSVQADTVADVILQKRSAVTVSPVRLYADSSFSKTTDIAYTEGELFEILGETVKEHFDNTETQTFKWFKVRAMNGKVGWLFGDNLAIVLNESALEKPMKPWYKKEYHFDNGFEKALIWFGGVEGHDKKKDENPDYKEFYLIITNEKGKSVSLNLSNVNESGKKSLENIYFKDVTNNKIDDIIIHTQIKDIHKNLPERYFEIHTFRASGLSKIFEEKLTLTWEEDVPSPAYSKFIEAEGSEIRIAYVDYLSCDRYSLGLLTDTRSQTMERCLEYVTYSYVWDNAQKTFEIFYKESRTPLNGIVTLKTTLYKTPSVSSDKIVVLDPAEKVIAIKHFDLIKSEKGVKKIENWLYVKHPSGIYGYIRAENIYFKNIEHVEVLKDYYSKPPLLKLDWKSDSVFVMMK